MDVVEDRGVGEVAVHGKGAWELPLLDPVHQLLEQLGVILEGSLSCLTLLLLLEAAELQRVVLARRADVVGDQVVVGNLVALLGVVPEPADVLDASAVVIDQGIVDGDGAVLAGAGVGGALQQVEASEVNRLDIPVLMVDEAVEAGLIRGLGELRVDAGDGLAGGHVQAGQVFPEVPPLGFVGEQVAKSTEGLLDDFGEGNDAGHGPDLRDRSGRKTFRQCTKRALFTPETLYFAKGQ